MRELHRGSAGGGAGSHRDVVLASAVVVLELMTEGPRTSEIARQLSISEVTVRRHASSVVSKLGVEDRAAAIAVLTGRSRV